MVIVLESYLPSIKLHDLCLGRIEQMAPHFVGPDDVLAVQGRREISVGVVDEVDGANGGTGQQCPLVHFLVTEVVVTEVVTDEVAVVVVFFTIVSIL